MICKKGNGNTVAGSHHLTENLVIESSERESADALHNYDALHLCTAC